MDDGDLLLPTPWYLFMDLIILLQLTVTPLRVGFDAALTQIPQVCLSLIKVMDGGEVVGVWRRDLTGECWCSLTRATGSVCDLVRFCGLLLLLL